MEAAGLASAIITFVDIAAKIVKRTQEFLNQAENAPAFLRAIDIRLPLLEKSLKSIYEEVLLQQTNTDPELKILPVVNAALVELERLHSYVVALSVRGITSKLQRFSRAIKSVLVYEGKINQTLKILDAYTRALDSYQISLVAGRTGRTEANTQKVLKTLQDDTVLDEAKRDQDAILVWLDGMPRDDYVNTCLTRKSAASSTWIFEKETYVSWQSKTFTNSPTRLLWIHGPAGCGKTFIAATMFDCFEDHQIEAAAVFWKNDAVFENATLDVIPRSWVRQLLLKHNINYEYVKPIWKVAKSSRASPPEVWSALKRILSLTTSVGITLFLDGLDVYREQQAKRARLPHREPNQTLQYISIREFLDDLKDTLEGEECRFVCFSRPDGDIRSQLSPSQIATADIPFKIDAWQHAITANDIREDIHELAFEIIKEQLPKKHYGFRLDLAHLIADQAESHLSMTILRREISSLKPTYSESKLRKMVEQFPHHLDDLYQADLDRIKQFPSEDQQRAWRMLHWVAHAVRLLSVQELLEAVLIEDDLEEFPVKDLSEDLDDEAIYGEITDLCGSFIAFDVGDHQDEPKFWKVRLAHPAVKDFLAGKGCTVPRLQLPSPCTAENASLSLGLLCIRYLMYKNIWPIAHTSISSASQSTMPCHPLLTYTATYFHHHIRSSAKEERGEVDFLLKIFLGQYFDRFSAWHQTAYTYSDYERAGMDLRPTWDWSCRLAFAAAVGLQDFVLQSSPSGKASSSELSHAICAASWSGRLDMVGALLDAGAKLDQVSPYGSTALHTAAFYGHPSIVTYLFERGADLNMVTDSSGTALHCAVEGGHEAVVQVLLSGGADATIARCSDGYLPIHVAAQSRNLHCMKALVGIHSAINKTINATTCQGWSALGIAVSHLDRETDRELVKLLLSHGGNPLQMFSDGRDPFFICAEHGNQDLFDMLQKQSVELPPATHTTLYTEGHSLLHAAVRGQRCDIVQSVLEAGIDWNHRDGSGQTAYDLAEPLSFDVSSFIVMFLARSQNGMAFLANKLATSPPDDPEVLEEYLITMHSNCLERNIAVPELLVKHLKTCQSERHKRTESNARSRAAAQAVEPSPD